MPFSLFLTWLTILFSAFEDHRFNPISLRELPSLECGVTLLTNFESVKDPMDWTIGTHGLRISFTHSNRRYGSTYLPDVAREQGWTREETMISLMRKAGWSGKSSDWRNVKDLNVVRYQGYRANLEYKEYGEWREWLEETGRDDTLDI
jgi:AMME syndrome candidate gene 1 protein